MAGHTEESAGYLSGNAPPEVDAYTPGRPVRATHITEFRIRPRAEDLKLDFGADAGDAPPSSAFIHFWFSFPIQLYVYVVAYLPRFPCDFYSCTKHIIQYSIFFMYVYGCFVCLFGVRECVHTCHAYGELATSFFAAFDFGFGFFVGESSRLAILSRFCEK